MTHSRSRAILAAAFVAATAPLSATAHAAGSIAGHLAERDGSPNRVANAVVFLLDAKTGHPLIATTRRPLSAKDDVSDLPGFWHNLTDQSGGFRFENVPAGQYRLAAQSWKGTVGLPDMRKTSEVVYLHGTAEGIEVRDDQETTAVIRPLGRGTLNVENDPKEAGAFLLLSTAPLLGDPILAFYGWGEDFVRNAVGMTHMSVPRATFVGLPEDRDVHLALFAYDNVPGSGGGAFRAGRNAVATVKIYAGWSNGHDEPPARLLLLVQHLEQNNPSLPELMQLGTPADFSDDLGRLDRRRLMTTVLQQAEKQVAIPGVGTFRVIDIAAADSYRHLRKHHAALRRNRKAAGVNPSAGTAINPTEQDVEADN